MSLNVFLSDQWFKTSRNSIQFTLVLHKEKGADPYVSVPVILKCLACLLGKGLNCWNGCSSVPKVPVLSFCRNISPAAGCLLQHQCLPGVFRTRSGWAISGHEVMWQLLLHSQVLETADYIVVGCCRPATKMRFNIFIIHESEYSVIYDKAANIHRSEAKTRESLLFFP